MPLPDVPMDLRPCPKCFLFALRRKQSLRSGAKGRLTSLGERADANAQPKSLSSSRDAKRNSKMNLLESPQESMQILSELHVKETVRAVPCQCLKCFQSRGANAAQREHLRGGSEVWH